MFLGEYQHSLDTKGRLTIPSKFREQLKDRFVATKGLENCIFLFSQDEWRNIEAKLHSLPMTRADARSFVRFFFSGASELELDKQGRTVLPSNLREYAGIDKDIVIIGVGSRAEIWAADKWVEYNQNNAGHYEQLAESLVDLGI
ncbi:MAG: division/cell wall cluster transcriptional repressor MraZ [Syntrophomonadaceae bacterium]|nr:division/cell wall cluster transcriptional repressor MraZ [Bacillota bacterium]NLM88487.1 division/cell wall cluster transcriptional repressor MraZ [Syntrophomonadaceae bacterium]HAA08982.1 cell division/cell wall cluster transcriptional repressor MraZ [Syntrophomonas sp.]HQA50600.1 division/cell wall cluster transcriptional repressor MraZ [Syntrophomonadaceae bacterium]HQD90499.1 division/cell wall cluster transcriptional repressor MraZ [Syntrophomonadaceae bacterium]